MRLKTKIFIFFLIFLYSCSIETNQIKVKKSLDLKDETIVKKTN